MKKKLGLDIDGVIADSQPVIIGKLNSFFNKKYTLSDFIDFDPVKMFGADRKTIDSIIMDWELEIIEKAQPINNAPLVIDRLHQYFTIHLISARTPIYFDNTVEWLNKFGIKYDTLLLLGKHDKRQACVDQSVDLFIEDNKKNAFQISSCGIPVYLYNATYNQGELPENILRVFSWKEIYYRINKDFYPGIDQRD